MYAPDSPSRDRALQAARTILDSVHALSATTYDPTLLPTLVVPIWETAANVLSLSYCAALVKGDHDEAMMYRSEVEVLL